MNYPSLCYDYTYIWILETAVFSNFLILQANSRQSHQVLVDNPAAHLHWTAHLEFTQNKSVDELTWDKISPLIPKSDKVSFRLH